AGCQRRSRAVRAWSIPRMSESAHAVSERPTLRRRARDPFAMPHSPARRTRRPPNGGRDSGSTPHRSGVGDATFSRVRRTLLVGGGGRTPGEGRFSFFDGDPLFELQRAAHLAGGRHEVLPRFLLLAAVALLPPLLQTLLRQDALTP